MAITVQERDQVLKIVAGLFNGAPGGAFLSDFSAAVEAGMTLSELARALAATNEFKQDIMGGKVTVEQQVAVLMNHFGVVADDVEGSAASQAHAFFTDSVNAKVDFGDIVYTAVVFLENDTSAEFAPFRDMLNNKAAVAVAHAENSTTIASVAAGQTILTGVTSEGPSTPEEIAEHLAGVSGGTSTFVLTTSADTVTGTAGNDTINGNTADTWTGFDAIDGGAGTDTMNVLLTGTAVPGASTITNVESLNINTTGAGFTIDTTSYTGLTAVKVASSAAGAIKVTGATTTAASVVGTGVVSTVDVIGTGGALSITTGAAAVKVGQTAVVNALTSATVVGGDTVDISDNKTTTQADGTTLTTVSLKGNTNAATLDTDGLTTLTLTNIVKDAADTTINAAAGTRALTVNVSGIDDDAAGTIEVTDATATTLNINATGASKDLKFTAGAATSVNIAADEALTIDDLVAGVATAVAISGDSKTTITADTLAAAAVVTSTNTGGVTITQALTANQQFVGTASSGNDSISIATASTKAHTTGAGDDTVIIGGAFGTGGSVDAGEGTDTLSLTETLAASDSLSANATFAGLISGFERLSLNTVTASKTVNLANLDNINHVTTTAATSLTLSNLASNGTLVLTAATNTVAVGVTDALTGTADVLNINLTQTADTAFGTVTASNVETLNIVSTDSNTTVAGTTDHSLTVVDTAAKAIVVTGNAHLTLTQASTALTSVDASGMTVASATAGADTQGLNFISGDLAQAATATGSAGVDSLDFSAVSTSKAMTINGGLGGKAGVTGDTLIGGAGDDTITVTGLGNATLTGGAGKDTITGSTGNDTITGGTGADTLTGGSGNDAFTLTSATDSAPSAFDTITDFVAKTATTAGDTIAFNSLIFSSTDTEVTVFVANSGSLALAALSSATFGANVINVALDSSTGTLYMDATSGTAGISDGIADLAIVMTGVTTITADAFAIS